MPKSCLSTRSSRAPLYTQPGHVSLQGMARLKTLSLIAAAALILSGCLVRTAVGVAGDVAEGAVNTTGAAVDAVTPDGDDKDDRKKEKKD